MKKLYAIVIGKKHKHLRYVACHHLPLPTAIPSEVPLAIYYGYQTAREARKFIRKQVSHNDVFIKRVQVED